MAEAALFSVAAKLLITIASPPLKMAYERGRSIRKVRDELAKLGKTLQAIQAVLLDAEKKQEGSHAVKLWIKRVRGVLYDAEDLFDEVTTNDQLNQQMMKSHKHTGKVCDTWALLLVDCFVLKPNMKILRFGSRLQRCVSSKKCILSPMYESVFSSLWPTFTKGERKVKS